MGYSEQVRNLRAIVADRRRNVTTSLPVPEKSIVVVANGVLLELRTGLSAIDNDCRWEQPAHSIVLYEPENNVVKTLEASGTIATDQTSATVQPQVMVATVEDITATLNRLIPGALQSVDTPFLQLGADSLTLAEVGNELSIITCKTISVFDLLEMKTTSGVLDYIFNKPKFTVH
jgi:hypothetical protein